MGRLAKASVPVYVVYGNHDAESQITKRLELPDNVKAFSSRKPQTFTIKDLHVALHGQSFRQRDISENLMLAYPEPVGGVFNIGVLHTGLGGMGSHPNYAPCTLDDLVNKGYQYWALGHVHRCNILHERPYVVAPGNIQGRNIRETGPKGAYVVSVEDGEVRDLVLFEADIVRWAVIPVAVDGESRVADVVDAIRNAIEQAAAGESDGRLLVGNVRLQGRTEIHDQLLASAEHLLAEARAAALGLGDEVAWVERLVVATEPAIDRATLAAREDAMGELQRILIDAEHDPEVLEGMKTEIGDFIRDLPHEVRTEAEDDILKAAIVGDHAGLINRVSMESAPGSSGRRPCECP
jgi:DNA repair exonuclease SbcCD nuclease subunit